MIVATGDAVTRALQLMSGEPDLFCSRDAGRLLRTRDCRGDAYENASTWKTDNKQCKNRHEWMKCRQNSNLFIISYLFFTFVREESVGGWGGIGRGRHRWLPLENGLLCRGAFFFLLQIKTAFP